MKIDLFWKDNNIFYNVLCFLITKNEKFRDRCDTQLYWKTVFHLFGTLHHFYVGLFSSSLDLSYPQIEILILKKYRVAYFTGWSFMFQTVFLSLSLIHDVLEWLQRHETTLGKKIRLCIDVIFSGLVVPFTLFISAMFWCVFWIDRELVFPAVYDSVVPWWFNHCVHTNIAIVVLIETILQPRRYPTRYKVELMLVGGVGVAYAIVYYSIYFFTHRWLYGVFGIMTWWQVCLYQLLIWGSTFVFYYLQFPINRLFHKPEDSTAITTVIEIKKSTDNNATDKNGTSQLSRDVKHRGKVENSDL